MIAIGIPAAARIDGLLMLTSSIPVCRDGSARCRFLRSEPGSLRQGQYAEAERLLHAQAQRLATTSEDTISSRYAAGELAACQERWDDAIRAWSSQVETSAMMGDLSDQVVGCSTWPRRMPVVAKAMTWHTPSSCRQARDRSTSHPCARLRAGY